MKTQEKVACLFYWRDRELEILDKDIKRIFLKWGFTREDIKKEHFSPSSFLSDQIFH